MHRCLQKPSCSLHAYVPQEETACIINIHISGYETLIMFKVKQTLQSNNKYSMCGAF